MTCAATHKATIEACWMLLREQQLRHSSGCVKSMLMLWTARDGDGAMVVAFDAACVKRVTTMRSTTALGCALVAHGT